jgi:DNA mismatch repair ATPase MutS
VPLLFLLDELFHGTNSHDRLVGASGVLRSLIDRGAVGLVTTHDLSLTAIVEALGPRAANVHFEDSFDGREMHFDYRVKAWTGHQEQRAGADARGRIGRGGTQ